MECTGQYPFDTFDGNLARWPGRSRFYAIADEVLGARRIVRGARFYLIPQPVSEEPAVPCAEPALADVDLDSARTARGR